MPRPTPPVPRPHNPIRNPRQIRAPTPLLHKAATANASAFRPPKRSCPNKECLDPKVEDGVCHSCGTVVDDSNIVSEITFGEDSRGGATMHGTMLHEGQGSAHGMGSARVPGADAGNSREATIREGKTQMDGFASQFEIRPACVEEGIQIFKLAATTNFIQGRRIDMVAAVCLYTACRRMERCRVMLIDFADRLSVNVFKLGHTFKSLHKRLALNADGAAPIVPEDLIYRFAFKLEFGDLTKKVAEAAIKLVKRMDKDWMLVGRRPSGICGACLILAARMFNFRRTVTEVVYIVKVTTATLQKRLDEFKLTPSSALSVADFMNNEPLESAHDPPAFYEKQEEFIKTKKRRKRKHRDQLPEDDEDNQAEGEVDSNKRQKVTTTSPDVILPTAELRRDAEGFAIPPQPPQPQPEFDDYADATEDDTAKALETIARKFGGADAMVSTSDDEDEEEEDDDAGSSTTSTTTTLKRSSGRRGNRNQQIIVPEEWSRDEEALENQIREILGNPKIAEMVSDPNTDHHTLLYNMAAKKAKQHMDHFEKTNPSKNIRDDEDILEDEFANDPEVQNCLLSSEDIARKEKVWVNENKSWLRLQQIKAYQKRMAANGPPKRTRNRKKVPKMGEGQTSPASTAGEAAVTVLKSRSLSKKVNYDAVGSLFDEMDGPGGRALGSAATSRVTSRAGSSVPESPSRSDSVTNEDDSEMSEAGIEDEKDYIRPAKPSTTSAAAKPQNPHPIAEESEDGEEEDLGDDYDEDEEPVDSEWKKIDNRDRGVDDAGDDEGQDGGEDDYDDGNDLGDIDVFGD